MNRRASWAVLIALASCTAAAAESAGEIERRVGDEVEAALLRLVDSGLLEGYEGRTLSVGREPRVRYELGAVVEIGSEAGSAPIVAITPGGSAERMGLRVGDRILAINGVDLTRSADPGADFARSTARANGQLQLTVARGGQQLELAGSAERVLVPGFRLRIEPADLP